MSREDDDVTKLRIVERSALSRGAAPATAQALASAGALRQLGPDKLLVRHGEPAAHIVLIGTGHARLWRPFPEAQARVAGYRSCGEVAGEATLGGAATYDESAEAMTDVEALLVPRDAISGLLAQDPALGEAARGLLFARHQAAEARLCALLRASAVERLAEFLVSAAERWGIPAGKAMRIAAVLTHEEIASAIGSTRETVTAALGKLRRAGVVAQPGRQVIILQPDALLQAASSTLRRERRTGGLPDAATSG